MSFLKRKSLESESFKPPRGGFYFLVSDLSTFFLYKFFLVLYNKSRKVFEKTRG